MFCTRLHGDYRAWYSRSLHKDQIDRAGEALLKKGYRYPVVQNHLLEWIKFSNYLSERNLPMPSRFFSKNVKRYLQERFPNGSESRRRGIEATIRIFLETDVSGNFPRRRKTPQCIPSFLYQQWMSQYLHYLRHVRNLSRNTLRSRERLLGKFANSLERSGVCSAEDLSYRLILDSFNNLGDWGQAMRSGYSSAIRGFLRWGYSQGVIPRDFSGAVLTPRSYRDATLPAVLSDEEVQNLLAGVERKTPLGKRNYAILLLAARYGLRPCDIRNLCLENIQWRAGVLSLTQSKTGKPLVLPLMADVATALIGYLRTARPPTQSRNVFIRHLAPYEPFSEDNNLAVIMQGALTQAGMGKGEGLRGMYLLRHSLATRLLKEGKSFKTISELLGHRDLNSTLIYSKVDLSALKSVAISIKEALS